jgi:hypothetical protein
MSSREPLVQDPVSALIREQNVRITAVHAVKKANLLLVMLNSGRLEFPLNGFARLAGASEAQLNDYELLPDGAGVEWPALDEHLSLRGFLLSAMRAMLQGPPPSRSGAKAVA